MNRTATVARETKETQILLKLDVDGKGSSSIQTGIGFFDHMLDSFARHGGFDIELVAKGDLHIDMHHTVEDTGIVLGQAFRDALAGFRGIRRFGSAYIPMDETLTRCAIDLSNRAYLVWKVAFSRPRVGDMTPNSSRNSTTPSP
jgi:imidazoleglycerol-phosphate dehydratase